MTKEQLARKRAELERQIAELERQERSIDAPEIEVAELLHDLMCHSNHTDGCAWLYESWDKPGGTRNRYRLKAKQVLSAAEAVSANFDPHESVVAILTEAMKL